MPPQGPVGVEAGGVDGVISKLEGTINNLRTSVTQIDDAAQAVLRGWKGDASSEFVKVAQAWHEEADALNKKFDRLSEAVNGGKSTLVNMDQGGLSGGGGTGGGTYTNL
ncbi:WXG100 family type VII secretion target [Nocardia mangyaensis]|uniref:WXG100 family type VII secretion target n=1 Tax=Nocardia mangyaensis TaxID=2213200 RepID=UPI002677201C|nr:WXG100 family type VII secretion target [Nocardia mangyaensis]MDO3647283.1 WXG100 family type VII secretion target [Nocardia mangyaensis]